VALYQIFIQQTSTCEMVKRKYSRGENEVNKFRFCKNESIELAQSSEIVAKTSSIFASSDIPMSSNSHSDNLPGNYFVLFPEGVTFTSDSFEYFLLIISYWLHLITALSLRLSNFFYVSCITNSLSYHELNGNHS